MHLVHLLFVGRQVDGQALLAQIRLLEACLFLLCLIVLQEFVGNQEVVPGEQKHDANQHNTGVFDRQGPAGNVIRVNILKVVEGHCPSFSSVTF